mgnify:CR=1 FL=1
MNLQSHKSSPCELLQRQFVENRYDATIWLAKHMSKKEKTVSMTIDEKSGHTRKLTNCKKEKKIYFPNGNDWRHHQKQHKLKS